MTFKLLDAGAEDVDELATLLLLAFEDDEVLKIILRDVTPEDAHAWAVAVFGQRYLLPDIQLYKVIQESTGKIVAMTALQFPWDKRPLPEELKAEVMSEDLSKLPPLKDGNQEMLMEFLAVLTGTKKYGYDPEKDYHRKGTVVHPDFQKMGHGTWVTRHCNAIADKDGRRTFLPARPSSIKMFTKEGFQTLGTYDCHVERFGGVAEKGMNWFTMRVPQPL